MRIFFDTELTGLVKDPKLISIGFVSEDARTFYAELSDTCEIDDCSGFVIETVLPLLEGGETLMSLHQLRRRLRVWLEAFGESVTLATDSLGWDWPRIHEIFPAPQDWPINVERRPLLLTMNYMNDFDKFEEGVERAFADGTLRRHHALDDAIANRLGWIANGGDADREADAR